MTIVKCSSSNKHRPRVSKPNLNLSPESGETVTSSSSDGSELDSGMESDGQDSSSSSEAAGTELVQFGGEKFHVPIELYDLKDLSFVLSVGNWNELLTEDERFRLASYLSDMDKEMLTMTLSELFSGRNFHFGNPVLDFFGRLKGGEFEPGVYLYRRSLKLFHRRKHYYGVQRYHDSMVSRLLRIKDTWEKCRGYSVKEKVRLLKIARSRNGDGVGSPMDSDDENLRNKKMKFGQNSEGRRRRPLEGFDWLRKQRIGIVGDDLGAKGYELNDRPKTGLLKAGKKQLFAPGYDEFGDEEHAEMSLITSERKISSEVTIASYDYHQPHDNPEKRDYFEKDWMYSTKIRSPVHDFRDESQPTHYPVKFDGRSISGTEWKVGGNFGSYGSKLGSDRSKQLYSDHVSNILRGRNFQSKVNFRGRVTDQGGETDSDSSDENGDDGDAIPLAEQLVYRNGAIEGSQSRIIRSAYDPIKVSKLGIQGQKPYALALNAAEAESFARHRKQKARMNLPAYLPRLKFPHTSDRVQLPSQKAYSREKRLNSDVDPVHSPPMTNYRPDSNNVQLEEFQDALNATSRLQNGHARANMLRNQAQFVDVPVAETDYHNESYLPLLACSAGTKKQSVKVDEIYTDESYENNKMNDLDIKKKKKTGAATGLLEVTPVPIISEKETIKDDMDARPEMKPFTLITPTVHSGFSFSIVHLLTVIRKALVISDRKVGTDVHNNENARIADPSLTIQEIANYVKSNPGDPCILETKVPLQDLIRGVLKIFSSKSSPLGAKGWKPLVTYEKSNKSWSWVGPTSSTMSDNDNILEQETSPDAWGIPYKMLLNLVNAFANWLKSSQETLQLIGSLPAPPIPVFPNLDEKERFRDLRAQRNPKTFNPSSEEQKAYFRKEEFLRYSIPDRAFFYTAADGKKSSVAPLRRGAGKPTSKARDHYMLKQDRPPHVTILCLVRDAAARLPGSIGTRADVCTLIRDSQYIVEDVTNKQVNQVVSGALDRLHYELDPCIHFDNERKLWVYMHRDREEEDFEDDGTSSTKNWRRPKKDVMENSDVEAVNHGNDDPSEVASPIGFDLNSDVNLDSSDDPDIQEKS